MRKLLVFILISLVCCRYDYDLIKNAFNFLKEKKYLDKIKTAIFMYGEIVAIEKCALYLQYCQELKPTEEPSDDPSGKPKEDPTDKPTDKTLNDTSGDILLPEIRRLADGDIILPPISNAKDSDSDDMTDIPESDMPVSDIPDTDMSDADTDIPETDKKTDEPEPKELDDEQMAINRAICYRIFGYF